MYDVGKKIGIHQKFLVTGVRGDLQWVFRPNAVKKLWTIWWTIYLNASIFKDIQPLMSTTDIEKLD